MNAVLIDLENHSQHICEEPNRVLLLCCKSLPPIAQPGTLQYSCPENPMDRGAWRGTVHRVAQSQARLKQLSTH